MNESLNNAKLEKREDTIEFESVTIEVFIEVLSKLPEESKKRMRLLGLDEMNEREIKTFLSKTRLSGFALDDSYIMNVFSKNEEKDGGTAAVNQAIREGGNWLKCADLEKGETWGLPNFYSGLGFKEFKELKIQTSQTLYS
ncbi:hypothetical protein ISS03_02835 [Patescibacteria group bacterium]|nr:hypothetical protein [Patescibacteria group bacterium]